VLVANDKIVSTEWLFYSLVHKNILKYIIGTTRLKLNKSELENIRIWVPSEKFIQELSNEMDEISRNRYIAEKKLNSSQSLKKSLINQVF
jgi:type I restriction enzyme S subunit